MATPAAIMDGTMGKALYRKYRSHTFDEVVGQDHITTALGNAISSGRIAHAYLLTGPRGVGKTSVARILAREINGLPYSENQHLDIIEIDAASNNSVEDVRELRDNILSAPTSAKYKIFIVDEVHMLSKAAFNALLKTLEEPPTHVIFILATTEAYKLPETIISRTQRYNFRPVPVETLVDHLRMIAQKEHISIDEPALRRIAEHGDGSFRDSISLLDQASNMSESVTNEAVEQLLGVAPKELMEQLMHAISTKNILSGVSAVQTLFDQGYEPAMIAAQLGQSIREGLLNPAVAQISTNDSVALLRGLLDVPGASNPKALLELLVVQACTVTAATSPNTQPAKKKAPTAEHSETPTENRETVDSIEQQATPPETGTIDVAEAQPVVVPAIEDTPKQAVTSDEAMWPAVLEQLKKKHNTLYGVARMAKPTFEDGKLTLAFSFAFHQKRFTEPKNREIIANILESLTGKPIEVVCIVDKASEDNSQKTTDVSTISNIFGGAELLES